MVLRRSGEDAPCCGGAVAWRHAAQAALHPCVPARGPFGATLRNPSCSCACLASSSSAAGRRRGLLSGSGVLPRSSNRSAPFFLT